MTKTRAAANTARGSRSGSTPGRGASAKKNARPSVTPRRSEPSYIYVYCAVRGEVDLKALGHVPRLPHGGPPRVLHLRDDLSAVVADVPASDYRTSRLEARLSDLAWVGRCGSAHHAVADALVLGHTVAPLRPFTIFSTEARARARLLALADDLDAALDRVSGKAEWVLRIGKPDPALKIADRRVAKAARAGSSGTAFLARKAAARQSAAELVTRVRRDAAAVYNALADLADQADQREPEPATGLVLDAAFLVPARQWAQFRRPLQSRAKGLLRDGCRVSLTGPWPPYSFVTLGSGMGRG
jgi:hypothetical protein